MKVEDVRDYYDANTGRFEALGQGGGTIHRAVWGQGVKSRDAAFRYLDDLVIAELERLRDQFPAPLEVLDLGCGLGASLFYLVEKDPIPGTGVHGTGVTLSPVQVERARAHCVQRGLSGRVDFLEADFLKLPSSVPCVHLAFSIEAFVHGPDPAAYFDAAAAHLHRGGILIVCDDFLSQRHQAQHSKRVSRWFDEVRHGWLMNTLLTTTQANALARQAGFELVSDTILTPMLELRRPRDRALSLLVAIGRHLPIKNWYWRSLLGGNALQRLLIEGYIDYRFVVWRKI